MLFGIKKKQNYYLDLSKNNSLKTKEESGKDKKEKIKKKKLLLSEEEKRKAERIRHFERLGFTLGKRLSEFKPPREDFSFHENVLRQTFGRGEKIWGVRMQPVELNFDLNPRQRGDASTAELFGFR